MEDALHYLWILQILLVVFISIPVLYWASMRIFTVPRDRNESKGDENQRICVILPMRNEEKNVERKLMNTLSEIVQYKSADLFVAVSGSNDGTMQIATEFLNSSDLEVERWKVMEFDTPGKNFALNQTLKKVNCDIIVVSDSDAYISGGWMEVVINRLSDSNIGVISGVEDGKSSGLKGFQRYYRSNSNWLRIRESEVGSTPVLEGSLIAWNSERMGSFSLDENVNADDAQVGMIAMRKGLRAVVEQRISFKNFDQEGRFFSESIRRSQGLSIVLANNVDLVFSGGNFRNSIAILNAIFLYIIFPWAVLLLSINTILAISISYPNESDWSLISGIFFSISAIAPQVRMVLLGVLISVISHVQIILGKRYNVWNPNR